MNKLKYVLVYAISVILLIFACVINLFITDETWNVKDVKYTNNTISVMTYNIRYENNHDLNERCWTERKYKILKQIERETPDIIGFQEVTNRQNSFFKEKLQGYTPVIYYRTSGLKEKESTPIYFRSDRFELISKDMFWLSETPGIESSSFGGRLPRICVTVKLKNRNTNQIVNIYNTHFDFSAEAKLQSANLILDRMDLNERNIFMGDLNSLEKGDAYNKLNSKLDNTKYVSEIVKSSYTFQGFGQEENPRVLDHIFVSKNAFNVKEYKVLNEKVDGIYASDHFAVKAVLEFK